MNSIYNTTYIDDIANKWSWKMYMSFAETKNGNGDIISTFGMDETNLLSDRIYSIGSLPTKKLNVVNTYQGGIRMTHPSRAYYTGDLEFEFYEDNKFSITNIFSKLLDNRFANITIIDEDYPYKDSVEEIYNIAISFFKPQTGEEVFKIVFRNCWVKEFEYLGTLETKNEEEMLKCKATIKYNFYEVF